MFKFYSPLNDVETLREKCTNFQFLALMRAFRTSIVLMYASNSIIAAYGPHTPSLTEFWICRHLEYPYFVSMRRYCAGRETTTDDNGSRKDTSEKGSTQLLFVESYMLLLAFHLVF